jgi:hypothetical protein
MLEGGIERRERQRETRVATIDGYRFGRALADGADPQQPST